MIFAALLLMQASPILTLSDLSHMPPDQAGSTLLKGLDHGPITEVVESSDRRLLPTGMVELQLVEKTALHDGACSRKRWKASLMHRQEDAPDKAVLLSRHGAEEVALPVSGACPGGDYVHVNPGMDVAQAVQALGRLADIKAGRAQVHFRCSDQTASGLCESAGKTQGEIGRLSPWAVSRSGQEMVFWLGTSGQTVTEVRFTPAQPGEVTVSRRIPPPA